MLDVEAQKALAARWAADQVGEGMIVGLGTGSTATWAVRALGERVRQGLRISGVATSTATAQLAQSLGIAVASLDDYPSLDLAIDGADQVDPQLNVIKGMGGALLQEKLVELAARELIIIVDQSKLVTVLGDRGPVPVEIVPFGWHRTQAAVEATGCRATLRKAGSGPFITDGGHFILDCHFGPIADPGALAGQLKALSGVIDHGLFLGVAGRVVTGRADGTVEVRRRGERAT